MVTEPDCLDAEAQRALIDPLGVISIPDLPKALSQAASQGKGGGPIGRLIAAMTGPSKLSVHEFIYYRLFDPTLPKPEIKRFLSQKMRHQQTLALNDPAGRAATFDKVLWDQQMVDAGLPHPAIRAVFGGTREPAQGRMLETRADLAGFLTEPGNLPLLAKPNFGGRSLGVFRIDSVEGDALRLHDGSLRPIDEVITFIDEFGTKGYIFQEVLRPDPASAALTGGAMATMRVFLLADADGVALENITLKVPRSGAVADNFWRGGNMMGAIDRETGQIRRAIAGSGIGLSEPDTHPDTGTPFLGWQLPDFPALQELCSRLAPAFPKLKLQGWDIAVTERGYVPIELNFGGDVNLQQLAHGAGAMTPAYCAHLRKHGFGGPLPD